ncbi:unnamed protein product [Durusdinium trenchii]|uniref:Uncharacterized protein n=1 Tax=Durusdinium trenchii TaxID=1381693 RepID=A0ABP0LHB7_9DINO
MRRGVAGTLTSAPLHTAPKNLRSCLICGRHQSARTGSRDAAPTPLIAACLHMGRKSFARHHPSAERSHRRSRQQTCALLRCWFLHFLLLPTLQGYSLGSLL